MTITLFLLIVAIAWIIDEPLKDYPTWVSIFVKLLVAIIFAKCWLIIFP